MQIANTSYLPQLVAKHWTTVPTSRVADPHHIDLDPAWHFDAYPDPDPACHFDADPDPDPTCHFDAVPDSDPTFHFDADLDPDPDPSFKIKKNAQK